MNTVFVTFSLIDLFLNEVSPLHLTHFVAGFIMVFFANSCLGCLMNFVSVRLNKNYRRMFICKRLVPFLSRGFFFVATFFLRKERFLL